MKELEPTRHPGLPATPIEEEAIKTKQSNVDVEVEAVAVSVTIFNDRRRPITNHHAKTSF